MRNLIFIFLILPFVLLGQNKPKPFVNPGKQSTNKPANSNPTKKPSSNSSKPSKPNPAVEKLVAEANTYFKESKDDECNKTISKILKLDPKNKDAYILKANMAIYNEDYETMWQSLNTIYKNNPKQSEIYALFSYSQFNNQLMSDSLKEVLILKSIVKDSRNADGFAYLGMLYASRGYYEQAMKYFDVCKFKNWKDTSASDVLDFFYARCLHFTKEDSAAIALLGNIIPKLKSSESLFARYTRSSYILDNDFALTPNYINELNEDIDTLKKSFNEDAAFMKLLADNALYNKNRDSACKMAKLGKTIDDQMPVDLCKYCDQLVQSVPIYAKRKLYYEAHDADLTFEFSEFDLKNNVSLTWKKETERKLETGQISMKKEALDSAYLQMLNFNNKSNDSLKNKLFFILSQKQMKQLLKDSSTLFRTDEYKLGSYKFIGYDQVLVYNQKEDEVFINCLLISDGEDLVWVVNDPENPLIVKMFLKDKNYTLIKFE